LKNDMQSAHVICGDAISAMRGLIHGQVFDGIITDPPYASGGQSLSERQQPTANKYTNTKRNCPIPNFEGDSLDQRSWTRWMTEVLRAGRDLCKPGAVLCAFVDWRQLPALTDALQWAGWIWRGIVVWDKNNSRPQRGRFRQQAEFVVWASNGSLPVDRPVPVMPGVYSVKPPVSNTRRHQTEKPLSLMCELVRICVPGGRILDPFCGSGTTLHAALLEGYSAVGVECSKHYATVAKERLKELAMKNTLV
jgi:site-specific DNA-methyltransferase (adenine-specific)